MPTKGYDPILSYTWQELKTMYIKQGWNARKAEKQAKIVSKAISAMNKAEQRLWNKARKYEILMDPTDIVIDEYE
jgi:hypothetical protein